MFVACHADGEENSAGLDGCRPTINAMMFGEASALAAIATVVFITRTGLAIHAGGIELLHLIGAADGYVARQFQGQALELALKGGALGFVLTAATVFLLGRAADALGAGILPDFSLSLVQWAALATVPLGVAVIGVLTARVTVMAALRELP